MKKIFFVLVAFVAMFAFTSCNNDTVESQIFDLSYEKGDLGDGDAALYETTYLPIFMAEIGKVAQPATESGRTFMVNATEKKAKADVKAAFDKAASEAQKLNDQSDIKLTGLKVILEHSTASNQNKKEFATYTFK
jgi:hypothetical protein